MFEWLNEDEVEHVHRACLLWPCLWMVNRNFFAWYKSRPKSYRMPKLSDFAHSCAFSAALKLYPKYITRTALETALNAGIDMESTLCTDMVAASVYGLITRPGKKTVNCEHHSKIPIDAFSHLAYEAARADNLGVLKWCDDRVASNGSKKHPRGLPRSVYIAYFSTHANTSELPVRNVFKRQNFNECICWAILHDDVKSLNFVFNYIDINFDFPDAYREDVVALAKRNPKCAKVLLDNEYLQETELDNASSA